MKTHVQNLTACQKEKAWDTWCILNVLVLSCFVWSVLFSSETWKLHFNAFSRSRVSGCRFWTWNSARLIFCRWRVAFGSGPGSSRSCCKHCSKVFAAWGLRMMWFGGGMLQDASLRKHEVGKATLSCFFHSKTAGRLHHWCLRKLANSLTIWLKAFLQCGPRTTQTL